MKHLHLAAGILLCLAMAPVSAQVSRTETPDALMLRFPDISADHIVFVYAGDLWTVPREGGLARRLSSPEGNEQFPKFSPDGQRIAFSGNYDGNTDIYIMPARGGPPTRLTHHPEADLIVEWYPDGASILYRSRMASPSRRFSRFFKQPVGGGLPETLPLAYGELASFSPDGSRMAFQFISRESRTWKRYRGGMASDLWLYDFVNNTSKKFTNFDGTDALPMWHENTIYFLSDRDEKKKLNIWAYDLKTEQVRQVTAFTEYDVKWPSLGPDAIVFENGGKLHVLSLQAETAQAISVQVPADLPDVRVQRKDISKSIRSFSLSPSGKRALFGARGEILTVPEKHGSVRNLTNTSGVREQYPAWSPDGKHIAYFSDRAGEYDLYVRPGNGKGHERRIATLGQGYRYGPRWSPDNKKIAFSDNAGSLSIVTVAEGKPALVDSSDWSRISDYAWSSDSRWLTYSNRMRNQQGAIFIYDTKRHKKVQITGDYYHDASPAFDPEGKYLFFYSERYFRPIYGDMDATWVYPNATEIYAITLRKDVESPIAPRSDEEEMGEETEDKNDKKKDDKDDKKKDDKNGKARKKAKPIEIDFDGIEKRAVKLPIKPGNFGALRAAKGKVVFLRRPAAGAAKPDPALIYYDLKERKEETIIPNVNAYSISADGKKVIYRSKATYGIIDLKKGQKVGDGKIVTDKMATWINPKAEWTQIFHEAWRIERDFFYDANMHGLDWEAIRGRYAALLPYVMDRENLNYIIGEMIAELNASHSYVGGGDRERPERISVGLLGCDFELDRANNAYRISKIYEGADWDAKVRSPLRRPGIVVNEGDYLLAVNGRPVDTSRDPWAAFQGLSGEVVALTLNASPAPEGAREVLVTPTSSESRLRNLAWIESNRKKVEAATDGKVGYIYVPDTGTFGQSEHVRQFTPQRTKAGLVIDERFNSGGQLPDRFIELLNRPVYSYIAHRHHRDRHTPYVSHTGPKVMLINQWAGSGGDAFPHYFRIAGLGPLVGMRTWGGLIGIGGDPRLVDGGSVRAPAHALWNPAGYWDVEGHGVDPDYEVENIPHEAAAGRDSQLDKAIEVILDLLQKQPPVEPARPAYPDRSK